MNCVKDSSGNSLCLTPCSSYTGCLLSEVCNNQLSPPSCYPNFCNAPWGSCAAADDSGTQHGTCQVYSDNQGNPVGLCVAGGSSATGGACSTSPTWSTSAAQACAPGNVCGTTSGGGAGSCYQGCDPTGSLGAPACSGSTSCVSQACDPTSDPNCCDPSTDILCDPTYPCDPTTDPNCDPYFGVCE